MTECYTTWCAGPVTARSTTSGCSEKNSRRVPVTCSGPRWSSSRGAGRASHGHPSIAQISQKVEFCSLSLLSSLTTDSLQCIVQPRAMCRSITASKLLALRSWTTFIVYHAKNPCAFDNSASIVLAPVDKRLINLHDRTWPANLFPSNCMLL